MSDNRAFLIYLDYEEHFKQITHEQVGELIMGMIAYSKTGIVPKFSDGAVSMAFSFMKSQLDRDSDAYRRKCEINQENGKHGGRPRNNRTVSEKTERFSEKPKKTERLIPKPKKPNTNTNANTNANTEIYSHAETAKAVSRESADVPLPEKNAPRSRKKESQDSYKQIQDMYNSICVSLPRLTTLSDARKRLIQTRLKSYSPEQIRAVFEKAEASSFLRGEKGGEKGTFKACFDWLMKDANFAKTLDGTYDDKIAAGSSRKADELDGIF